MRGWCPLAVVACRAAAVAGVFFPSASILELDSTAWQKAALQRIRDKVRFAYAYQLPYDLFAKSAMALFWPNSVPRAEARGRTRLTRFLGFYPNVEAWHEGDFFDMANACFVPSRPLPPRLSGAARAALIPLSCG